MSEQGVIDRVCLRATRGLDEAGQCWLIACFWLAVLAAGSAAAVVATSRSMRRRQRAR